MTLVKTSLLNGLAVVVRTLTVFALNKVLAVYVGPAGYAVVGQLQNAIAVILTISSGSIAPGVTKYTADLVGDPFRSAKLWRTAVGVSAAGALVSSATLLIFNRPLAKYFFSDEEFGYVFIWLSGSLFFYILNTLLLSVLNGRREVFKYVFANICGSLVTLSVTGFLVVNWGLKGALIGLTVNQSVSLIVTIAIVSRADWFNFRGLIGQIDWPTLRGLANYSIMGITSALAAPIGQLMIRDHLGAVYGLEFAGHWEAMNRISSLYLTAITTTFSLYYLPRLSELYDLSEVRLEVAKIAMLLMPCVTVAAVLIYLNKALVIEVAFDDSFAPMHHLFAWQMVGDILKVFSWIFSFLLLARAKVGVFVLLEIVYNIIYVVFAQVFTGIWGGEAVVMAYAVMYFCFGISSWLGCRWTGIF